MKSDLLLPQSLIKENSVSIRQALLLIAIVVLWVYLPFLRYGGELSAHEGFYAVCADEYSPGLLVRANGEVQSQVWPHPHRKRRQRTPGKEHQHADQPQ